MRNPNQMTNRELSYELMSVNAVLKRHREGNYRNKLLRKKDMILRVMAKAVVKEYKKRYGRNGQ